MQRSLTLLSSLLTTGALLNAQTLVDPGNVPVVGNTFLVHATAYTDPGAAGSGITWDFSSLLTDSLITFEVIDVGASQWASTFPDAEYAVTDGSDTLFYSVSANGIEREGEDATFQLLTAAEVQVPYTDTKLDLKLPASMGTTWSDIYAASFDVGGIVGVINRSGAVNGEVDGVGTLVLPDVSIDNCLRVHTRLDETNTAALGVAYHTRDEWAWYTEWQKHPFLRVISDTIDVPAFSITQILRTVQWMDTVNVSVNEVPGANNGVLVMPNPASDRLVVVNMTTGRMTSVQLLDATGRVVRHLPVPVSSTSVEVDVRGLHAGCYTVRMTDADGRARSSRVVVR